MRSGDLHWVAGIARVRIMGDMPAFALALVIDYDDEHEKAM